jgi:hypothetical protein
MAEPKKPPKIPKALYYCRFGITHNPVADTATSAAESRRKCQHRKSDRGHYPQCADCPGPVVYGRTMKGGE